MVKMDIGNDLNIQSLQAIHEATHPAQSGQLKYMLDGDKSRKSINQLDNELKCSHNVATL